MARESKLVELRHKTDQDLVNLVRRELDRGLALADVAVSKQSPLFARAERAYAIAKACLPLISSLDRNERRELEGRLKQLWTALDQLHSERIQPHLTAV